MPFALFHEASQSYDIPDSYVVARLAGADPHRHARFCERLEAEGVWALDQGERGIRFVTHRGIDDAAVDRARAGFEKALRESS